MNFEIHWPRDTANFEYLGDIHSKMITVKHTGDIPTEFYLLSLSFMEAANKLISHVLHARENRKKDFWFFSIVYLYRQGLELMIKSIAFKYIKLDASRKNFISRVRHNLKDSFFEVNALVKEDSYQLTEEQFLWLSAFLSNISYIDEQSDMFRYPFNQKMEIFFSSQTHVNLRALGTNMINAFNILESLRNKQDIHCDLTCDPSLLIEGGSYNEQSVIGWNFYHRNYNFYPYIEGYMESADYICKLIMETDDNGHLFLPMCYMYRNAIELALKRILIEDCRYEQSIAFKKIKRKKHSVLGIWNLIREDIMLYSNAPDDDKTIEIVEIYINQLHNLDQTSDKFRYPIDTSLNLHFMNSKKFDVENISTCFNELFSFLDAVHSMLSSYKDIQSELTWEGDYY
ncbi:hypothetical protein [Robertmurraya mangrovi]|uniref:hypothetical protein n=1 Tax=Robertmurraya mangrovi TaxID=3098077 RepID=UPI002ACC1A07|nr:hypothetical protein [Bacillus sp. 31A1R]